MADNRGFQVTPTATDFQKRVMDGILELARVRGATGVVFKYDNTGSGYFAASVRLGDKSFDLEIYDYVAYAQLGASRYESGVFDYPSKVADADDFVRRLDQLSRLGTWFRPDDPGIASSIVDAFRRLFRSKRRD